MTKNINSVKAQMIGAGVSQFAAWLHSDAPFQAISANPKLIRDVQVRSVSLLEDSTAVIEFVQTTSQGPATSKPDIKTFALTIRYQIVPPTADAALTANPFGIFVPYFVLQRTGQNT